MSWTFPTYQPGEPIDWAALEARFDWLRDMAAVPQDPIWHAEGDVLIHTKMVIEALLAMPAYQALPPQDQQVLFAAALMHDIEKRSTTTTEIQDGVERIISPGHAKRGEFTVRALLYREMPAPFEVREQIAKLVRLHGLPLWAIEREDPRREVIGASLQVNTEHLALLARADMLGRICEDQEELLLRIGLFEELCRENNCWGQPRAFNSNYGRFLFLNKPEVAPDYEPFDDLKFEVFVMCALPGSGKDTYIRQYLDLPVLSLDDIRRAHKIDPKDKKKNGQVIQLAKEQAKVFMRARTSFVFNATNITRDMRGRWISLFTDYGGKVTIVYLEVPYQQLLTQNHKRTYKVPPVVIDRLINRLEIPSFSEAHELRFILNGKQESR